MTLTSTARKPIIWNGTLDVAEMPSFAKGTNAVTDMLVERTRAGATTIIAGVIQPLRLSKREQLAR